MFHYTAFGLNISSEIKLPGMNENVNTDKSDVGISLGEINPSVTNPVIKGPNYVVNHENVYIWWEDIGKVKIKNGNQIIVDPLSDLEKSDKTNIIPFLLGPVMSTLLHQRGFLVLHGSSVKVNNEAIAFLGYRGLGKSTTAIQLYKEGYSVLTDDILAIDFDDQGAPVLYPGYPHVRLSEDSYKHIKDEISILTPIRTYAEKIFCDASRGYSQLPVKLKKIYILKKSDKIQLSMLRSQKNLIDLIRHSIPNWNFKIYDQAMNLNQCAQLIRHTEICRLEILHSFEDISKVIKLIKKDLSAGHDF